MVLTVTLNPLLEKKLFFKELKFSNNRAYKQSMLAGGKGINISRQLNCVGIKNHALLFIGGANGKKLRAILESEKISFSAVTTKSETREASLIFDESKNELQTYFGVNSNISSDEIDSFLQKLEKSIINSSIVVFSGSLPSEETSIIIEKGIEFCHKYDKISVLDSYGINLKKQFCLGPTVVHNNFSEIESSLSTKLDNETGIRATLNYLNESNVRLAFLTSGHKDSYASKYDFHYKIHNPIINEVDPTGSGDAFLSGIIYGLEKSLIFNDFVKLAAALGAKNASSTDVCNVSLNDAEEIVDEVTIHEIGKKIKIIDDSPTI